MIIAGGMAAKFVLYPISNEIAEIVRKNHSGGPGLVIDVIEERPRQLQMH